MDYLTRSLTRVPSDRRQDGKRTDQTSRVEPVVWIMPDAAPRGFSVPDSAKSNLKTRGRNRLPVEIVVNRSTVDWFLSESLKAREQRLGTVFHGSTLRDLFEPPQFRLER